MKRILVFIVFVLMLANLSAQSVDKAVGHQSTGLTTAQLNALPTALKIGLTIRDITLGYVVTYDEGTSTFIKAGGGAGGGGTTYFAGTGLTLNGTTFNIDVPFTSVIQSAIDANTAKTGITSQQASDIITNNAKVSYPGDQDISGISTNASDITALENEQTTQDAAIALNTSKVSYPGNASIQPDWSNIQNIPADIADGDDTGGAGSDGNISNVALSGTNLVFTGSNGGFNGPVALAVLQDGFEPDTKNTQAETVANVNAEYPNLDTDSTDDISLGGFNTWTSFNTFNNGLQANGSNTSGVSPLIVRNLANGGYVAQRFVFSTLGGAQRNLFYGGYESSGTNYFSFALDDDITDPAFRIETLNGNVRVKSLEGAGDRMVVANSTGDLSTQAIPSGGGSGYEILVGTGDEDDVNAALLTAGTTPVHIIADITALDSPILVGSNQTLIIEKGVTISPNNSLTSTEAVIRNRDASNDNITIKGGGTVDGTAATSIALAAVAFDNVTNSVIENIHAKNVSITASAADGNFRIIDSDNITIRNCSSIDSWRIGVYITGGSNNVIEGGYFTRNRDSGIGVVDSSGFILKDALVDNCGTSDASNVTINMIDALVDGLISINASGAINGNGLTIGHSGYPADYGKVINSRFEGNTKGIHFQGTGTSDILISDNTIINNGIGIRMLTGVEGITITDNVLGNTADFSITAGLNDISIYGNKQFAREGFTVIEATAPTTSNLWTDATMKLNRLEQANNSFIGLTMPTSTTNLFGASFGTQRRTGGTDFITELRAHKGTESGVVTFSVDDDGNGEFSGSVNIPTGQDFTIGGVPVSAGGGSNNDVLTFKDPADGYTFLDTDFDNGRMVIEDFGASDEEYILDDVAAIGEKLVISQKGTGKIQVAEGTASLPLGEFQTKDNQSHLTLYKASDSNYYVIGDWDTYTSTPAVTNYMTASAATFGNETNTVGDFRVGSGDGADGLVWSSSTEQVYDGTYSMKGTFGTGTSGDSWDKDIRVPSIPIGNATTINMWVYLPTGSTPFTVGAQNGSDGNWNAADNTSVLIDTFDTWIEVTLNMPNGPDSNPNDIGFYHTTVVDNGEFFIDRVLITQ